MSDQTDFNVLYRELGVEPDCALDDFRLAYRRRVADLHPDRAGASGEDDLKSLNLRYAAALEFHRHYGRLPGAPSAPAGHRIRRAVGPSPPHAAPDADESPWEPVETPDSRRPSKFVVYGMVLVAVLLVWWFSRADTGAPGLREIGIVGNERETTAPAAISLRLGMSREQVVAMLGEPASLEQGGMQWRYGPSWVRFACAEVVDWYSSPLQPLKASRSRPPEDAAMHAAAVAARPCPEAASASSRDWRVP